MSHDPLIESPNLIIKALSHPDQELLAPHLERVPLERDDVLARTNEHIRHMYFLEGGVASMTALSTDGERTEIGVIGFEGVSGLSQVLGSNCSPHETFMQIGDTHALRIDSGRFAAAFEQSQSLRQIVLRLIHTSMVQMSQSAVAYARFQIEGRLARCALPPENRTIRG